MPEPEKNLRANLEDAKSKLYRLRDLVKINGTRPSMTLSQEDQDSCARVLAHNLDVHEHAYVIATDAYSKKMASLIRTEPEKDGNSGDLFNTFGHGSLERFLFGFSI